MNLLELSRTTNLLLYISLPTKPFPSHHYQNKFTKNTFKKKAFCCSTRIMNAHPLYGSYWNLPSRPRKAPTVREIPVHYVRLEHPLVHRSASAVKIQKVFRGFLVRKSVKKIVEIRSQVEEIERRMAKEETVELIRRDGKERLRVNEMLMSLLFKLDSVRGVDSGVRECRKTVIKKAISLQEALDAVASSNGDDNGENVVEAVEETVTATECTEENAEVEVDDDDKEIVKNDQNDDVEEEEREVVENYDVIPSVSDCPEPEESVGTSQTECHLPSITEAREEDDSWSSKQEIDDIETNQVEEREVVEKATRKVPRTGEENARNRELLERMMEDNEKMMDLMAQLFERNEMQTRLLSSLSERVGQLEKAFMCERLRKKKKRQAAGIVDGSERHRITRNAGRDSEFRMNDFV